MLTKQIFIFVRQMLFQIQVALKIQAINLQLYLLLFSFQFLASSVSASLYSLVSKEMIQIEIGHITEIINLLLVVLIFKSSILIRWVHSIKMLLKLVRYVWNKNATFELIVVIYIILNAFLLGFIKDKSVLFV